MGRAAGTSPLAGQAPARSARWPRRESEPARGASGPVRRRNRCPDRLRGSPDARGRSARSSWRSRAGSSRWQASQWACSAIARRVSVIWHEMRQTGQSRSQCSSSSPSRAPCRQALTTWSGSSPQLLGEGQWADSGHLLGWPECQVLAKPVDDRRVDALFDQSVEEPFQPLPPRGRHLGRLFERDRRRRKTLAGFGSSRLRRSADRRAPGFCAS